MHNFATPAPVAATLDIPAGRVRFIAADRTDTTVVVLPADAAKSRDVKAAEQTGVEYRDGVLRIQTAAKNKLMGSTGSVEVTVQLPAGSSVDAKAASAEFQCTGRLGEVSFEGSHGSVEIDEAASAHLTLASGDVQVGRLTGSAQISTMQGDIRVTEAAHGTVVLRAQAGAITVGAAPGVSASLDADTASGRIHNSLKNNGSRDLEIHATTSHGDITARGL
ncbi:DUF4097 family beta strand repeat-containing protein [Actinomadura hibisca]|uniref:DUF4097 family beta strand repeat-containing protein n=1 Tax=Actinomadura hibisca TaxID=68565 RepID=UPI00082D27A0|nr:DUF4097 family beta strand repeat-containing protein [Actinomadura hibisca]